MRWVRGRAPRLASPSLLPRQEERFSRPSAVAKPEVLGRVPQTQRSEREMQLRRPAVWRGRSPARQSERRGRQPTDRHSDRWQWLALLRCEIGRASWWGRGENLAVAGVLK